MQISQHSRIWIYQSNREFTYKETEAIANLLQQFVGQWQAHGHDLAAEFEIRYKRFIILAVDESIAGATGCSIDKSVKLMQEIETKYSLTLFDRFNIAYRDEKDNIISCNREEFEQKIAAGSVGVNTIVFNNLIQFADELNTQWEVPFHASWHARVFHLHPSRVS